MKTIKVIITSGMLAVALLLNTSFNGIQITQAEVTKEHVRKSMEETTKRNKRIEKFNEDVYQRMAASGFNEIQVSIAGGNLLSDEAPYIGVSLPSEEFRDKHIKEITRILKEEMKSSGLDELPIKFDVDPRIVEGNSDKEQMKFTRELFDIIQETVKDKGYKVLSIGLGPSVSTPTIEIKIEASKEEYTKVKSDIEKSVHYALLSQKQIDSVIKLTRRTESEIMEMKWEPIFSAIMDEVDKHFDVANGFAYSFHPMPLQIIIKTSLSSHDKDTKTKAQEIKHYVEKVVEIKREELGIKKIPYTVIIRDKNHHQIK